MIIVIRNLKKLEETLLECRHQQAAMNNVMRGLAPLATTLQHDVTSISGQVGTMVAVVTRGLNGLSNDLADLEQQLA